MVNSTVCTVVQKVSTVILAKGTSLPMVITPALNVIRMKTASAVTLPWNISEQILPSIMAITF